MSTLSKKVEWCYRLLVSKELALSLLLLLCVVLAPGTFMERTDISLRGLPRVILGLLGLNLIACTVRKRTALPAPVIVMHVGTILTLAGTVISSLGFVATVNVYEGTVVDSAYRWDRKTDQPLGVNLSVKKMDGEYYPVGVKLGVLKGQERFGLFVLKTGESFNLGQYTVRADSLEFLSENLRLSVFEGTQLLGTADTEAAKDLPADFPYDFKLVAYQNPVLKRAWVDLALSNGPVVVAEGTSEANRPLTWGKMAFYFVKASKDRYGLPYAGIQIKNDPGRPYVFMGFGVIGLGAVMYLFRRRVRVGK